MINIKNYTIITNSIFIALFFTKLLNVILERIDWILFLFWLLPLMIFYVFVNKFFIRAYQWLCFLLIIYFLFSSLRVFGTDPFWLDILELILLISLFINIMFGPKIINNMQ